MTTLNPGDWVALRLEPGWCTLVGQVAHRLPDEDGWAVRPVRQGRRLSPDVTPVLNVDVLDTRVHFEDSMLTRWIVTVRGSS